MMSETTILSIATLHDRVEAIFRKAGLNAIQAGAVARVIVAGERDHCKSHGIYRIEGALRTVKAGKVKRTQFLKSLRKKLPALCG